MNYDNFTKKITYTDTNARTDSCEIVFMPECWSLSVVP